ncbi:MAG: TrkH family potassium uptake protein, partial [Candidatus Marinimicrobia bacterium]|nr:TrkH family potassium uptake protein [Candidatus Neomarinimicrobiota bacterium]
MNKKTILNILGAQITILSITMLIPAIMSLAYQENDFEGFILSFVITILIGVPLWFFTRKSKALSNKDGFLIVTAAWIITAIIGALPFFFSGTIPNITDAFFESMSGVTTTGATILGNPMTLPNLPNGIESLPHGILFWRSFIQWIGGMGIIVFTIAILPLLGIGGVQMFKAEVPGPVSDKLRPRVKETAKILWLVYVGFTAVEALLLIIGGMTGFEAVCHAFTTMPTGGFSTMNASIAGWANSAIHYIIIFFMLMAGINFSLHFRAMSGDVKSYFRDYEFKIFIGIILLVTFGIFIIVSLSDGGFTHIKFRDSLFQTVSIITTTGYGTYDYELWSYFIQFTLVGLMFIGAMGGSTGGGMKIIRVFIIIKHSLMETRRLLHARAIIPIRIGNRYIDESIIRNTLGFFLFYIAIFALTAASLTAMGIDITSAIGA